MKDKVFKVASGVMNVPMGLLNEQSSPDTVEKWDSIMHMNLILAMEEEFNIRFSDKEIVEALSLGKIIETLKKKKIQDDL